MGFKDVVAADRSAVFLNLGEFAESVTIEGREVSIVIDDDALRERKSGQEIGVAESATLFFARVEDLPPRRGPGENLNINGRECIVDEWDEAAGMATVVLHDTIPV